MYIHSCGRSRITINTLLARVSRSVPCACCLGWHHHAFHPVQPVCSCTSILSRYPRKELGFGWHPRCSLLDWRSHHDHSERPEHQPWCWPSSSSSNTIRQNHSSKVLIHCSSHIYARAMHDKALYLSLLFEDISRSIFENQKPDVSDDHFHYHLHTGSRFSSHLSVRPCCKPLLGYRVFGSNMFENTKYYDPNCGL